MNNVDHEGYIKSLNYMPSIPNKVITNRQFNYLCGQAAARGTFYERYKNSTSKKLQASLDRLSELK